MKGWRKFRLGDGCITNANSYTPKEKWKFVNYLDTGNITDNKINAIQYIDIKNKKLPSRARRKVQENSIIYSTVRPKQRHFGIIKNQPDNFLVSTGFVVIDVNESILDADFLYYLLTQNIVVEKLHIIAEQSVSSYPSIKPSDIENLEISIPDIVVQKRIASILGCLDKKIEQNNMINKNLSEQLQALYTSEFDVTIHHATAKLSDICHYSVEKVNVDELSTKTYYSTENMQPNKVSSVEATNLPNIKQTTRCHKGDVLVSNIRPFFKKIEYVTTECGCSTDVLCFVPASKELSAFLYETLYADRFFDYMVAGSKGTKMPRGDKQQIMQYEVVMPSSEQLLAFNAAATPMLALITNGLLENERLSMLRDSLLPRLMAGELDVSDIDF